MFSHTEWQIGAFNTGYKMAISVQILVLKGGLFLLMNLRKIQQMKIV